MLIMAFIMIPNFPVLKSFEIVNTCSEKAHSKNHSRQAVFQVRRSRCKDVKDQAGVSFPVARPVSFLIIIIITHLSSSASQKWKTNHCHQLHIDESLMSQLRTQSANNNCHCHHHHHHFHHHHHHHHCRHHHHHPDYHNQVRVTKRADGREENMRDLGRGDYFGEQVILA